MIFVEFKLALVAVTYSLVSLRCWLGVKEKSSPKPGLAPHHISVQIISHSARAIHLLGNLLAELLPENQN